MSGVLQLVSSLVHTSGLPEDTFQNVIHCDVAGSDPAGQDIIDAMGAFRDFYITNPGAQTVPLSAVISDAVSRVASACSIAAYFTNDYSGVSPFGSPIGNLAFTMPAPNASTQLPEEVAIVISVNGDLDDVPVTATNPDPPPAVIRPQARRRGRLYLGPLTQTAGTEVDTSYRPNATLRSDAGLAIATMYNAIVTLTPYVLGVWSKADEVVHPIVAGYVDDAWDTQRRRGLAATLRTTFTI